jgi:hypothetical protein
MYFDNGYIPEVTTNRLNEIEPATTFIAKKMVTLRNTLATSQDTEEQITTISQLLLCQSSISLLMMAYLTDDYSYVEKSKHLYRGL